jgi:PKD repeat protein
VVYASQTTEEVPFTVAFTDESSGSSIEWKWDFGDGDTSTAENPSTNTPKREYIK